MFCDVNTALPANRVNETLFPKKKGNAKFKAF